MSNSLDPDSISRSVMVFLLLKVVLTTYLDAFGRLTMVCVGRYRLYRQRPVVFPARGCRPGTLIRVSWPAYVLTYGVARGGTGKQGAGLRKALMYDSA